MKITGALLAESASAVDNKLDITGGVVSRCAPGPDRIVQATLVVLIQPEPGDTSAVVDVTLTPPVGDAVHSQVPVPESSLGGEVGFMTLPMQIAVPVAGRYVFSVGTAPGAIDLPLNVLG